jgi:histidine triad (HIT) family protein
LKENDVADSPKFADNCKFCKIVKGELDSFVVFDDDISVGILDHRPLFPGHVLLIPKMHYITIGDLPGDLVGGFFTNVQLLSIAVEQAMQSQGTFVGMNNRVSQSIPHLHVHIVPRNKGDGLRGFFWPRQKYSSEEHKTQVQRMISEAISALKPFCSSPNALGED